MKLIGYVPPVLHAQAMDENMSRRRRSNNLNYQRQIYEAIENNNEYMFGDMLDTEMRELSRKTYKMSEVI